MTLHISDLDHVSKLAHLTLTDTEKHTYLGQLQSILGHMDELNQLNLSEPALIPHTETPLREDQVISQSIDFKKNAPDWDNGGYFIVPKMLED